MDGTTFHCRGHYSCVCVIAVSSLKHFHWTSAASALQFAHKSFSLESQLWLSEKCLRPAIGWIQRCHLQVVIDWTQDVPEKVDNVTQMIGFSSEPEVSLGYSLVNWNIAMPKFWYMKAWSDDPWLRLEYQRPPATQHWSCMPHVPFTAIQDKTRYMVNPAAPVILRSFWVSADEPMPAPSSSDLIPVSSISLSGFTGQWRWIPHFTPLIHGIHFDPWTKDFPH